jgi:hypothetical protein
MLLLHKKILSHQYLNHSYYGSNIGEIRYTWKEEYMINSRLVGLWSLKF